MHLPFLERASRPGNQERTHALGAFLTLRAVDRIAFHSPVQGESLAFQLRAAATFLDQLKPQNKDVSHLREIIRVAQRATTSGNLNLLWAPLLALAYWLEGELRLQESIDVLETAFRLQSGARIPEEVAAGLQHGRVLRQLGCFPEARASYLAAGQLASEFGDTRSLLISRIGHAWVAVKTGDLAAAQQELHQVLRDAQLQGDLFVEARAAHGLADVLHLAGRTAEGIPLVFRAYGLYEEPDQRTRSLNDLGIFLKELGHYAAAKEAFLLVLEARPSPELSVKPKLELLELSAILHDRVGFARWRRELDNQHDRLPPDEKAEFELKLGMGFAAFDSPREALEHLSRALTIAEEFKFGQQVFEAERAIAEINAGHSASKEALAPRVATEDSPVVLQTIESLYALRAG